MLLEVKITLVFREGMMTGRTHRVTSKMLLMF